MSDALLLPAHHDGLERRFGVWVLSRE